MESDSDDYTSSEVAGSDEEEEPERETSAPAASAASGSVEDMTSLLEEFSNAGPASEAPSLEANPTETPVVEVLEDTPTPTPAKPSEPQTQTAPPETAPPETAHSETAPAETAPAETPPAETPPAQTVPAASHPAPEPSVKKALEPLPCPSNEKPSVFAAPDPSSGLSYTCSALFLLHSKSWCG